MTNLTVRQKRYIEIDGIAKDEDANILDITSPAKLIFMVKENYADADADAKITKTTDDATEIERVNASQGEYKVYITADDNNLTVGPYYYEVVYSVDPGGDPQQVYTCNHGYYKVDRVVVQTI